ncbi:hypothetical protein FXB39_01355 [Nocardioides sp. BGMRC 2183]|nr:hypothetical protein FXB39_01355 [Nocardioides sp. BGMRC 2183]
MMGGPTVTTELEMLRAVELKSRVRPEDVAEPLAISPEQAGDELAALVERGLVAAAGRGFRISPEGKQHLAVLLEEDRAGIDNAALAVAYEEFCVFNSELKQIITDWQVGPSGAPNDHTDAAYDAHVLDRLTSLHHRFQPLLERFGRIAPRLQAYPRRFAHACERIAAGETLWVARPITDSFHTVWFELHEDLIQLSGRTRAEEAAAGRAH